MDKTSKKLIDYLKNQPYNRLFYYDQPYEALNIDEEEFFRCIKHLEKNELVEFVSNQDGIRLGVQLTHEAVHAKEIARSARLNSFAHWFFHSYIGGIITGVSTTLFTQLIIFKGPAIFAKLLALLGFL